jgi:hypothetical protein
LEHQYIEHFTPKTQENRQHRNHDADLIEIQITEEDSDYSKIIQKHLDIILSYFQEPKKLHEQGSEEKTMISYISWNFINENYGDIIHHYFLPADNIYNDRLNLVSHTFQFLEEISCIQESIDYLSALKKQESRRQFTTLKLIKSYLKIIYNQNNRFKKNILDVDLNNEIYCQLWESMNKKLHLMNSISIQKKVVKPTKQSPVSEVS